MRTVLNGFIVSTEPSEKNHVLLTIAKGNGSYTVYYQPPIKEEDATDKAIELTIQHNAILSVMAIEKLIPKEGGDIAREHIQHIKRQMRVHSHCEHCNTPLMTRVLYPCPACRREFIK